MIKIKKYLPAVLSFLLITFFCEAKTISDSTEAEKMTAKANAVIAHLGDSISAAISADQDSSGKAPVYNGPTGQETYVSDTIHKHSFSKKNWKDVTKGLNYEERSEKPKPQKHQKVNFQHEDEHSVFQVDSSIGQTILIIVVALLVGFILYKFFSGNISNTKVGKQKTYRIEEIEEALHESDLERYLREAVANKEFRLAIRIYYLMAIKALSERDWIKWKKDKTNNQYLFEMNARPNFSSFRDLTRLFEFAWYGEMTVDEKHFQLLDPKFREFLKQLNTLPL